MTEKHVAEAIQLCHEAKARIVAVIVDLNGKLAPYGVFANVVEVNMTAADGIEVDIDIEECGE